MIGMNSFPCNSLSHLNVLVILVALCLVLEAGEEGPAVRVRGVDEDDLRVLESLEQLHPHVRLVTVRRHSAQE